MGGAVRPVVRAREEHNPILMAVLAHELIAWAVSEEVHELF